MHIYTIALPILSLEDSLSTARNKDLLKIMLKEITANNCYINSTGNILLYLAFLFKITSLFLCVNVHIDVSLVTLIEIAKYCPVFIEYMQDHSQEFKWMLKWFSLRM